jgi:hypothetical protein
LLKFITNPYVIAALVAIAATMGGVYLLNLKRVREETEKLNQANGEMKKSLDSLGDLGSISAPAQKIVDGVKIAVGNAGSDAKRMKAAYDKVKDAEYRIKKLGLDPLAKSLLTSELERLKASLEKKAITLKVNIDTGDSENNTPYTRTQQLTARDRIALQYGRESKVGPIWNLQNVRGPIVDNGKRSQREAFEKATGLKGSVSEILDQMADRAVAQKSNGAIAGDRLTDAAAKYRTAKDENKATALKELNKLYDEYAAKQKRGIQFSDEEGRALAGVVGVIESAKRSITPFGPTVSPDKQIQGQVANALNDFKLARNKDESQAAVDVLESLRRGLEDQRGDGKLSPSAKVQLVKLNKALQNEVSDHVRNMVSQYQQTATGAPKDALKKQLNAALAQRRNVVGGQSDAVGRRTYAEITAIQRALEGRSTGADGGGAKDAFSARITELINLLKTAKGTKETDKAIADLRKSQTYLQGLKNTDAIQDKELKGLVRVNTALEKVAKERTKTVNDAHNKALKVEKDRLTDAASEYDRLASQAKSAYEKMANAAEQSGKRQLDALLGVRDALRDVLGGMQEALAKFGVFSSPLDARLARIQSVVGMGAKLGDLAGQLEKQFGSLQNAGDAAIKANSDHANLARNSLELLQGGDGQNARGRGGSAVASSDIGGRIADAAVAMQTKYGDRIGKEFYQQCDRLADTTVNSATSIYDKIMGPRGKGESAARTMGRFQKAGIGMAPNGQYAAGDIGYSGAKYGGGSGHVQVRGKDGNWYDQYGAHQKSTTPIEWVVRAGGKKGAAAGGGSFAGAVGGDYSQTNPDGLNLQSAFELVKSIREEIGKSSLLKLTALPKAWGQPIADSARYAQTFGAQMMLANEATQKMLRLVLGDAGFDKLVRELKGATLEADRFIAKMTATKALEDASRDLQKKARLRGKEDNPFALLSENFTNGEMREADPLKKQVLMTRTLRDALDTVTQATKDNSRATELRLKRVKMMRDATGAATFSEYEYARATELGGKKMEWWNQKNVRDLLERSDVLEKAARLDKAKAVAARVAGNSGLATNLDKRALGLFEQSKEIRTSLSRDYNTYAVGEERAHNLEKGQERTVDHAKTIAAFDRENVQLQARLKLVASNAMGDAALNRALEDQSYYFEQLYRLREQNHGDERSRELAREYAARRKANQALREEGDLVVERNKTVGGLDREFSGLVERLNLVRQNTTGQIGLNRAIENQNYYTEQLNRLLDANGGLDQAKQLASEYAMRRRANAALIEQIALETELKQLKLDSMDEHYASVSQRLLYANAPLGADNLDEIGARLAKMSELNSAAAMDKFKGNVDLWRQNYDAKMGDYDKKATDTRELKAQQALYQAQTTLAQRKLEINGPITELAKEEAAWTARIEAMKLNGLAVSEKEVELREKLRGILQDNLAIDREAFERKMSNAVRDAGQFNPDYARTKSIWDDAKGAGYSDAEINAKMPEWLKLDKLAAWKEEVVGMGGQVKDELSQMFLGLKTTGLGAIGSLFDGITNRLEQWASELLASEAIKLLANLFGLGVGTFAGGAPAAGGAPNMGGGTGVSFSRGGAGPTGLATGLDRVPFDRFPALLHKNERVLSAAAASAHDSLNRSHNRKAREVESNGAKREMILSNQQTTQNINFSGPVSFPNVRRAEDMPAEIGRHVERAQPSRRSNARDLRTATLQGA